MLDNLISVVGGAFGVAIVAVYLGACHFCFLCRFCNRLRSY